MRPRSGRSVLALLLLGPVVELAVAIEVGRRVGTLPTMLALVALSAVGVLVLTRQGRGWVRALQQAAATGTPPGAGADVARVATRAGAGILLVLPGFVSGLLGLLLLVPPVGAGVRRLAARRMTHVAAEPGAPRRPGGGAVVITGEVIETSGGGQQDDPPPAVGAADPAER